MTPDKQSETTQQLHDAADELFDIREVCEGFADMTETWQAQAVLKQLSIEAGKRVAAWYQFLCDATDVRICAALTWRDAHPRNCLREAERIAETIEEG